MLLIQFKSGLFTRSGILYLHKRIKKDDSQYARKMSQYWKG